MALVVQAAIQGGLASISSSVLSAFLDQSAQRFQNQSGVLAAIHY